MRSVEFLLERREIGHPLGLSPARRYASIDEQVVSSIKPGCIAWPRRSPLSFATMIGNPEFESLIRELSQASAGFDRPLESGCAARTPLIRAISDQAPCAGTRAIDVRFGQVCRVFGLPEAESPFN